MTARAGGSGMTLALVGASHRTASIEIRERFHVGHESVGSFLDRVRRDPGVRECVILSTCNRSELYLRAESRERAEAVGRSALAERAAMAPDEAGDHLYVLRGREVARHLFRVVSGLESLVVGEPEIQGQVGDAYDAAREADPENVGPVLHRLFQAALSAGGEVRARTRLSEGAASVPSAAVQLVQKVFGDLEGRRALVVGAGEMGRSTLGALLDRGFEEVLVASRTVERAEATARRTGARPVPYRTVWRRLEDTDVLVTSTSAPHPVVTVEKMRGLRGDRGTPLVVVDIAVPRDVEPGVGELPGLFLYNIDDLQRVVKATEETRSGEREAATALLEEGVDDFWRWYQAREAVPLIRELRERAERVRRREVEEALRNIEGLSEEDRAAIHRASRLALKKVLHPPTVGLRELAADDRGFEWLEVARRLFGLEDDLEREEGDG